MEAYRPRGSEEELSKPNAEQQEVVSEPIPENPPTFTVAEGELATKALERQPVVVVDRVSKAAEADKPIEKQYETRHEIKDEPTTSQPVSVGSVLAKLPKPTPSQDMGDDSQPSAPKVPPKKSVNLTDDELPSAISTYRIAMRAGFFAAIVIIFVFTLLLIIT